MEQVHDMIVCKVGLIITSQIILQFMDNLSIFHKRNSIVINLVVHTKLNIIPILVCMFETGV
jgi:hypothetical protein